MMLYIFMHSNINPSLAVLVSLLGLIELVQSATAGTNWTNQPDIRTGRNTIINLPSSFYRSSDTPLSYNVTFTSIGNPIKSVGVSLTCFETPITNDFGLNISADNYSSASFRLRFSAYGDTLVNQIRCDYIAIGTSVYFAEVLYNCHLCSVLNTGYGDKVETKTGITMLGTSANLKVNTYLSGFWVRNTQGLVNFLSVSAAMQTGTNVINYRFRATENNTVTFVCYITTILSQEATTDIYLYHGDAGATLFGFDLGITPTATANNFNFPAPGPDFTDNNRMFYGISSFNVSRARGRKYCLDTSLFDKLASNIQDTFSLNVGTYEIKVDFMRVAKHSCNSSFQYFHVTDYLCYDECNNSNPSTYDNDVSSSKFCNGCHPTCKTCNASLATDCLTCEILNFRALTGAKQCSCISGYIDIGVQLCYPCSTFMPGCLTCLSASQCQSCDSSFILTAEAKCQCTVGHLISGLCTNITGCTALVQYSGTVYCTSCNATLHFELSATYACQCQAGYYIFNNEVCLPRCGDGRKITQQGCDDGNLIAGDGCDAMCAVEDNWTCFNGSNVSASVCMVDNQFSAKIVFVRRVVDSNTMSIGLRVSPVYASFSRVNFKNFMTHNVPSTEVNVTYQGDGLIYMDFAYTRSIQAENFLLNFQLDPTLFSNAKFSVELPASGMNAKLTYDSVNNLNKPLEIIVIVLDVLAWLVALASCVSEKMIGVEMMQTLQIALFAQSVVKTLPSSFMPLQMLRYLSGYNQAQGVSYQRTYTIAFSLSSIGLEKQFLLSFNIMYGVVVVACLVSLGFKIKQTYEIIRLEKATTQSDENNWTEKINWSTKVFNFVFQRLLFLLVFVLMFQIVFALMLQLTDMQGASWLLSKQFNLLSAIIAIAVVITFVCGVIINGFFPNILLFPMLMKQAYPPFYFIYQSALIFTLAFMYTQEYVLYIIEGLSLLGLILLVIYRPYPEKFHNLMLIFHQVFIMAVVGIYIYENISKPQENETLYKILNGLVMALVFLIIIANGYRVFKYYQFLKLRNWNQYGNFDNAFEQYEMKNISNLSNTKNLITDRETVYPQTNRYKGKDLDNMQVKKSRDPAEKPKKSGDNPKKPQPDTLPANDHNNINWNYNRLALDETDNQTLKLNASLVKPEPKTGKVTGRGLPSNNQQPEEPKGTAPEHDTDEIENPYDPNSSLNTPAQDWQDPLSKIKRKMKEDYTARSKVLAPQR